MKLEKINPFIQARYEHGFRTLPALFRFIGIPFKSTYNFWEKGAFAYIYEGPSWGVFTKYCSALGITTDEGNNIMSNLHAWNRNKDIEIVKPNWDDYKHIKPFCGKNPPLTDSVAPMCTLDTSNTDISHEKEMLDNPLKRWRAEKDLTRYEAAEIIGIDSTNYALIEDGAYKPASDILAKITEATGLSLTQIAKIYCPLPDEAREEYAKLKSTTVKDIVEDMQTPEYKEMVEEAVEKVDDVIDSDSRHSCKEAQIILDIVYGKVTLKEYRKIEMILGR